MHQLKKSRLNRHTLDLYPTRPLVGFFCCNISDTILVTGNML
ncbi:hypothetical protein L479_01557 [Exiguobacterium sp. S17]|nr:hypothetical protein L479_01557 [Exiguobacterium sp. S17]